MHRLPAWCAGNGKLSLLYNKAVITPVKGFAVQDYFLFAEPDGQTVSGFLFRITSYNVCYTKLLRQDFHRTERGHQKLVKGAELPLPGNGEAGENHHHHRADHSTKR